MSSLADDDLHPSVENYRMESKGNVTSNYLNRNTTTTTTTKNNIVAAVVGKKKSNSDLLCLLQSIIADHDSENFGLLSW